MKKESLPPSTGSAEVMVVAPMTLPAVVVSPVPEPSSQAAKTCQLQKEYLNYRQDLGKTVNDHILHQTNRKKYAIKIDDFRKKYGIPLSVAIDAPLAEKEQIVYNNCKPSCSGKVHQVFTSRLEGNKNIYLLTTSGKLKKMRVHRSGLEVLTLNELNKKGAPFRSWQLPMDDGPWFISGNDIYKGMDIEGVFLKVTPQGKWTIVPSNGKGAVQPVKLVGTEGVRVPGCSEDELCLTTPNKKRYFRAPPVCGAHPTSSDTP